MNEYILIVENLTKIYDKFQLKNVSFKLKRGQIMGFIGPNGAGKSTTIKSIMGIIPFDSGNILIDGKDFQKNEIEIKKVIGYVGEHLDFYEHVKLKKIYRFIRAFYKDWNEDLFRNLINRFGLDLEKKMKELSKGMVVKFSLALALAHFPKLLILDEPTSGLDPIVRNDILDILKEYAKNNCSILFSSHITEDIIKIADEVTYINNGEIKLIENKKVILNYYFKVNISAINRLKNCKVIFKNENEAIIYVDSYTLKQLDLLPEKESFTKISLDELLNFIVKL
ncbi:ABC transporter related protein [Caldicellulosiruptor acetigenus I77R1B]|uniref:ABC transporter ATP-binding protein n=2 Tax=Caldicellulosiruptor TaxID=44000 RepID=A0A3T0D3C1_9FIRM|nr:MULTISPECIES: ABC transporter ATP-binding protein [Caldicellulosiruptor]ADQ39791.1 ABC transporter related protein [Caldicellulosiruptor acetigenus I77R1B]AZT89316.1 ABC transporter ATP-binding protein [Caldicellulosiruptor changbaiensis]